jgi:hypothetical protein
MKLSGLHLLLTYQCTFECAHCFTWGSPWQQGTMSLETIRLILSQAKDMKTVNTIYFEGGEPFLYYGVLLKAVQESVALGFRTGIVSNVFWADTREDALANLKPFSGLLENIFISSDLYHGDEKLNFRYRNANFAAQELGIPIYTMTVAQPEETDAIRTYGQLPSGESGVMYRGRAAVELASRAAMQAWEQYSTCPHENLLDPDRIHIDPLGYAHICQGIALGNCLSMHLQQISTGYRPDHHPITGPLLQGGPAELVRQYHLPHAEKYADACHLCYDARLKLRSQFPEILAPDQMYGVFGK